MSQLLTSKCRQYLILLTFLVGVSLMARAESVEIDGLYYELNWATRTATVTYQTTSEDNYSSLPANVIIPATVTYSGNLFSVTTIGDRAFAYCSTIESVSIPASVTLIASTKMDSSGHIQPFSCANLKCVRLEDGDTPIQLGSLNYGVLTNGYGQRYDGHTSLKIFGSNLEEVYIGRNINYGADCSSRPFEVYNYIYDYSPFYEQPKLTKVTIGPTVSEIPSYLFYKNESLILLSLPNVESIGSHAFEDCSKLTTLDMGNKLTKVGDRAFYNCTNVTKLTFPNTLESIGNETFYNCTSVTEVTVGSGLRSIGESAFMNCMSFTAVILPDDFTTMGASAFENCTKLTIARLGQSITGIPSRAFKNCVSLSEMVVPSSAKEIGNQAFFNNSGLATITLNEGLETIGDEVFWNNSGIIRFQIPGTVTYMGRSCFYGCERVMYLTFMDGTKTLTINNSNTESSKESGGVKYNYFFDCPIRFLTLGRNLIYAYDDGPASAPFVNHTDLVSVTLGKNVTFLYNHLFNGCTNIKKIIMPDGMKRIHPYALANCGSLNELSFPNPLELLGDHACENDTTLASVVFNEAPGNDLDFVIGTYTFKNCPALTSLTFPAKTISIGDFCFYDTRNLTSITFTDSYRSILLGYGAKVDVTQGIDRDKYMPLFGNSRLKYLYIGRNIDYPTSEFDSWAREYGYSPFYNQTFLTDVKFSMSDHVTFCQSHLLRGVNNCEELILPESLTTIGDYTFSGMSILKGIVIPNAVTEIGECAFAYDQNLKYARLSTSCPWLKYGLFQNCESLAEIIIPPVVTKMDDNIFSACVSLTSATFEGSKEVLTMGFDTSGKDGQGLFRSCALETLNLDRWLSYNTEHPDRAPFCHIGELKHLTLGENVGAIDKYMFSYCTGLEELYLPDNIESVGLWGFRGCSALKSVRFSEKLSQVSDYGFSECVSLDNVVFPASMTSIADNSFSNCTSLKKLDLGKNLNIIGPAAFKNDTALEGIEIPETLYGLGVEAFANCSSLPNVSIRAISSVGKQAFQGCTGLRWVSLSEKTTSLGEDSFADCTGIGYVKSYAEFPPEGLVNFPAEVVENGTLFVPEYSVDYYQYSPTWEDWHSIRPLNDNVMVSSITLDKSAISFKAAETSQLTAKVGAENATDKTILWRTSNDEIATVDETGLVTAVAVGEATVTALAADGSGEKGVCQVTVLPTMVENIAINSEVASLKKGRTLELIATVAPATATNPTYSWSTSDTAVATIDPNGKLTAIAPGNVDITATANDGSGISTSIALTVILPTKGDSNDNDEVTITDAVNTANYAVGNEVADFCFEGADVNGDNRITLADASGTVTIILEQPSEDTSAMAKAKGMMSENKADFLSMDAYSVEKGSKATIPVSLDNTIDYVALQADITVPEGMRIEGVKIGNRAKATHSLMQKRIDSRTMRVVLFDLNNSVFADIAESIFEIVISAEKANQGVVEIRNIIASDCHANEYTLTSRGGRFSDASGAEMNTVSDIRIEAAAGVISILNGEGCEIAVYSENGITLHRSVADADRVDIAVETGVYVVTAGSKTVKVIVK